MQTQGARPQSPCSERRCQPRSSAIWQQAAGRSASRGSGPHWGNDLHILRGCQDWARATPQTPPEPFELCDSWSKSTPAQEPRPPALRARSSRSPCSGIRASGLWPPAWDWLYPNPCLGWEAHRRKRHISPSGGRPCALLSGTWASSPVLGLSSEALAPTGECVPWSLLAG